MQTSYDLEKKLSESLERIRAEQDKVSKIKREMIALRRQRRKPVEYPKEVIDWFAETEEEEEE